MKLWAELDSLIGLAKIKKLVKELPGVYPDSAPPGSATFGHRAFGAAHDLQGQSGNRQNYSRAADGELV